MKDNYRIPHFEEKIQMADATKPINYAVIRRLAEVAQQRTFAATKSGKLGPASKCTRLDKNSAEFRAVASRYERASVSTTDDMSRKR